MNLEVGMPAAMAARRAGVTVGKLREYDASGIVVPSARTAKGAPLYTPEDVELIRTARQLELAVAFSADELGRLLHLESVVKRERDKLARTEDLLEMRTILAYLLSELGDLREIVARKQEGLLQQDERLANWVDEFRNWRTGR